MGRILQYPKNASETASSLVHRQEHGAAALGPAPEHNSGHQQSSLGVRSLRISGRGYKLCPKFVAAPAEAGEEDRICWFLRPGTKPETCDRNSDRNCDRTRENEPKLGSIGTSQIRPAIGSRDQRNSAGKE